jgi:hypothetical protein
MTISGEVISEDMKNILKWFEQVMRRKETKAVRVVMKMNVKGKIGRRPKKRWLDTIENDMRAVTVTVKRKQNRRKSL